MSTPFGLLWPKFSTREAERQGESHGSCCLFRRLGRTSTKSQGVAAKPHFSWLWRRFCSQFGTAEAGMWTSERLIPRSLSLQCPLARPRPVVVRTTPSLSNGQAAPSRRSSTAPGRRPSSLADARQRSAEEALYRVHALQRTCEARGRGVPAFCNASASRRSTAAFAGVPHDGGHAIRPEPRFLNPHSRGPMQRAPRRAPISGVRSEC